MDVASMNGEQAFNNNLIENNKTEKSDNIAVADDISNIIKTSDFEHFTRDMSDIYNSIDDCFGTGRDFRAIKKLQKGFYNMTNREKKDIAMEASDDKSIFDEAKCYGKILKDINSNENIDEDDKGKLRGTLNLYYNKAVGADATGMTCTVSKAFNYSSTTKMSSKKIIDSSKLLNGVKSLFSEAKEFFKSNYNGTEEELDKYLESKFCETKNINELGYKDFKTLRTSISSGFKGASKFKEGMENTLNNLVNCGTSKIVSDTLSEAISHYDASENEHN